LQLSLSTIFWSLRTTFNSFLITYFRLFYLRLKKPSKCTFLNYNCIIRVYALTQKHGILFIVDDIQVGVGRTGQFFSFEDTSIKPDMVLLSKSISGFGLPLSLVLIKPEHDKWKPGEHTGTFRCNNLSVIAATKALSFWEEPVFHNELISKSRFLYEALEKIRCTYSEVITDIRGKGMIVGLEFRDSKIAKKIQDLAFQNGLIIEMAGGEGNVLQCMPALTIERAQLLEGFSIIEKCIIMARVSSEITEKKIKTGPPK
jgi:diaminobutyrate-2-oxoglutarate transaminase